MAYIVQADIESRFGEANVQKWSQLDADDVTVDSTRIADAISTAEQDIDNRFRNSRWTVPFSGTIPKKVVEWAAVLAGWWLYTSRGLRDEDEANQMRRIKEDVDAEIAMYLANMRTLDSEESGSHPTAPIAL